jgi:hypothetical protein
MFEPEGRSNVGGYIPSLDANGGASRHFRAVGDPENMVEVKPASARPLPAADGPRVPAEEAEPLKTVTVGLEVGDFEMQVVDLAISPDGYALLLLPARGTRLKLNAGADLRLLTEAYALKARVLSSRFQVGCGRAASAILLQIIEREAQTRLDPLSQAMEESHDGEAGRDPAGPDQDGEAGQPAPV